MEQTESQKVNLDQIFCGQNTYVAVALAYGVNSQSTYPPVMRGRTSFEPPKPEEAV